MQSVTGQVVTELEYSGALTAGETSTIYKSFKQMVEYTSWTVFIILG